MVLVACASALKCYACSEITVAGTKMGEDPAGGLVNCMDVKKSNVDDEYKKNKDDEKWSAPEEDHFLQTCLSNQTKCIEYQLEGTIIGSKMSAFGRSCMAPSEANCEYGQLMLSENGQVAVTDYKCNMQTCTGDYCNLDLHINSGSVLSAGLLALLSAAAILL